MLYHENDKLSTLTCGVVDYFNSIQLFLLGSEAGFPSMLYHEQGHLSIPTVMS
jgi:hypothetical protein